MSDTRIALALSVGVAMVAQQAEAQKLIVTSSTPATHWSSAQVVDPYFACVAERSKGEIEFEYYHSGQLASNTQALEAVTAGLAQMALVVLSAQTDKLPLSGMTMLPGLGESVKEMTAAYRAELDSNGHLSAEFAQNNIVPLVINFFPPYQLVSRKAPFSSLDAVQGMRISGGGGPLLVTLAALGAVGVETPAADLYIALQQGVIDGSMISLATITPYSLQEVITSTSVNAHFGTSVSVWSIDANTFSGLSEQGQTALRDCGRETEDRLAAWVDDWMVEVRSELEQTGVEAFEYDAAALDALNARLTQAQEEYLGRLTARGLPAVEAFQQYTGRFGN